MISSSSFWLIFDDDVRLETGFFLQHKNVTTLVLLMELSWKMSEQLTRSSSSCGPDWNNNWTSRGMTSLFLVRVLIWVRDKTETTFDFTHLECYSALNPSPSTGQRILQARRRFRSVDSDSPFTIPTREWINKLFIFKKLVLPGNQSGQWFPWNLETNEMIIYCRNSAIDGARSRRPRAKHSASFDFYAGNVIVDVITFSGLP